MFNMRLILNGTILVKKKTLHNTCSVLLLLVRQKLAYLTYLLLLIKRNEQKNIFTNFTLKLYIYKMHFKLFVIIIKLILLIYKYL